MTTSAAATTVVLVPAWARVLLILVVLVEALWAASSVPILFGDISEIPGYTLGGWTITATIVLKPLFALAAVLLAAIGQARSAVWAMAGVVLLHWFSMLPSVVLHGLDWSGIGWVSSGPFILYPALALAGAWLAWRGERPGLAVLLVTLPTLLNVLGVVAFGIAIMIYGF